MTYLLFLVLLVGLPLGLLTTWGILRRQPAAPAGMGMVIVGIAVPAAIIWDHQAAHWGMWQWSAALTLGWRWWGLPVEEVAFILMLVLIIMALCARLGHLPPLTTPWRHAAAVLLVLALGAEIGCALWVWRLALLPGRAHPMYLTYLLACTLPIMALHWLIGGRHLWHARHVLLGVVVSVAVWYTVADALALRAGIWSFATADLAGVWLGNVPIEEVVFFSNVALLVAQTYLILLGYGWNQIGSIVPGSWLTPVVAMLTRRDQPPYRFYHSAAHPSGLRIGFRRHTL